MKLKSNFSYDLDFKPLGLWPDTVPAVALGQQLLCGFQLADQHPVFEHAFTTQTAALDLFKSLYPQLTLPELARLIHSSEFKNFFESTALLKAYNFHSSPELLEVLELLFQSPAEFQNFVSLKKIGPQELVPMLGLNFQQREFVATEILAADESKQESVKRIELLADLILMGQTEDSLKTLNQTELTKKRFPVTTTRDENLKSSNLPWLSQIKTQFKRRGDKAGFEVQFFAGTPAELTKLAANLTKVAESWNSKS